jgi:outer membrane protein TolC
VALDAEAAFWRWREAATRVEQTRDAAAQGEVMGRALDEAFQVAARRPPIQEVLIDRVVASQAQGAYVQALYQYALALAALERATAGGICPPFEQPPPPTQQPQRDGT